MNAFDDSLREKNQQLLIVLVVVVVIVVVIIHTFPLWQQYPSPSDTRGLTAVCVRIRQETKPSRRVVLQCCVVRVADGDGGRKGLIILPLT